MSTPTASSSQPAAGKGARPRPTPPARYRNFIAGKWVESAATKGVPNVSPADTRVSLGEVPYSTPAEVDAAVAAAASAFPAWRDTPSPVRGNLLVRWAALLTAHTDELAAILAWEEGKTFGEARGEVLKATNIVEFMAGEGRRIGGHTIPSEMPRTFVYTVKAPLGVVGVITPWNFPIAIPCWKIAPALVAGNTIVFKPATLTPWTALRAVELLEEAGLPPGVLNLVFGSGAAVGDQLVHHKAIRAVSFTGSNEVGTHVYTEGAKRLLKVQCELGGKNPLVVLEDADLELAADATAQGASRLRAAGINTLSLKVDHISDFYRAVRLMGLLLGDSSRAATVAARGASARSGSSMPSHRTPESRPARTTPACCVSAARWMPARPLTRRSCRSGRGPCQTAERRHPLVTREDVDPVANRRDARAERRGARPG
jgi:hypothetical protein